MLIQTLVVVIAVVLGVVAVVRLAHTWWKYRGQRVITCPENQKPAGVVVDARHAAETALGKSPELRLSSCSRWPERAGCGQQCLSQIAASPEDCLVRNILTKWYEGKTCAYCGQPIGEIDWAGRKPALLRADGVSVEWSEVPADKLYETLAAASPVCFACHMANKLVREHPDWPLIDPDPKHDPGPRPEAAGCTFGRDTPEMVVFNHPHRPDAASSDCWSISWPLVRSVHLRKA